MLSALKKPPFHTLRESRMYNYTYYSLVLGLIYPVVNNGSFLTNLISLACTGLAVAAVFCYISEYSLNKSSFTLKLFIFTVLYMLFIGILGGSLRGGKTILLLTITQDLRYTALFLLGGLYAQSERTMDLFHQLMRSVACIAVIMGVLALVMIAGSGSLIARGGEDATSYHYWWASATCFAYCGLYSFLSDEDKKLNQGVLLLYFIVGMSFLKRSCFINVVLIVILGLYMLSKLGQGGKLASRISVIALLSFVVMIFLPGVADKVFGLLFDRFSKTASDMKSFDRLLEFAVFEHKTSLEQRLTGFGIGHYLSIDRYGVGGKKELLNALHLGYANILYKGGLVYAAFYVITYLNVIFNWFRKQQCSIRYYVCVGVAISAFISLFYEGSWTYTILPFCISAPIFYAARYKGGD